MSWHPLLFLSLSGGYSQFASLPEYNRTAALQLASTKLWDYLSSNYYYTLEMAQCNYSIFSTSFIKKCLRHLNSPNPSILRGRVAFCLSLFHNSLMNVIQKMLKDYYEIIEYDIKPRPVVMENIEKVINCGDPSYGGAMYGCPQCGKLKFVPFRCHSKFCPTCGAKYSNDRSTAMSFKLINCTHRHLVFTIDESLRHFFLEDRDLLNGLFEAVSDVIKELFFSLNKSRNFVPGFLCVLHTFGRPLEWNPHIHCLLTEGGYSDDGFWRTVKYFNYSYLRKSFQTVLLNKLEKRIDPSFKKTKSEIYRKDKNGFYVYAKPNLCDPMKTILSSERLFRRLILLSCSSSTSLKKISRWRATMGFMPDIAKSTISCTRQSINQNTESFLISIPGASVFFLLWAMTLYNAQTAKKKCSFLSYIINMNAFLWWNYTKGLW